MSNEIVKTCFFREQERYTQAQIGEMLLEKKDNADFHNLSLNAIATKSIDKV